MCIVIHMMEDLLTRVQRTRRVPAPWGDDPARGLTTRRLDELIEVWTTRFDWETHRRRIESYPWTSTGRGDTALRLIDQRPTDPDAPVVVLLHGWPDSVLRFERVLPLLADLRVVVPALPGFPFSRTPDDAAVSIDRTADMIAAALDELGCPRYVVSGGDVGGTVAEILAGRYPDRVGALHLTNVAPQRALTADRSTLPAEAVAHLDDAARWFRSEGGYIAEQSTRPNTLAVALGDSPAGLAAWIVEKLASWSDSSDGPAFTDDELLTWVTAYWSTGTIGTSFAAYTEPVVVPDRVDTPTVLSTFAHDLKPEPTGYAQAFLDVRAHVHHDVGGHFAAWEQPAAYVDDLRQAVALATHA